MESLPNELQVLILSSLSKKDKLKCRLVSKNWHDLVNTSTLLKETWFYVTNGNDTSFIPNAVRDHSMTAVTRLVLYDTKLLNVMEMDQGLKDFLSRLTDLSVQKSKVRPRAMEAVLKQCANLEVLNLTEIKSLFTCQTFLQDEQDRKELTITLKNVTQLNISCNRDLSDDSFKKLTSCLVNLRSLDLSNIYMKSHTGTYIPLFKRPDLPHLILSFQSVCEFMASRSGKIKCLRLCSNNLNDDDICALGRIENLDLQTLQLSYYPKSSKSLVDLIIGQQFKKLSLSSSHRERKKFDVVRLTNSADIIKVISVIEHCMLWYMQLMQYISSFQIQYNFNQREHGILQNLYAFFTFSK